jgi:predicted acylesterase/phospholipase RssA
LQELGIPLVDLPVLGTSAGAWAGAALALGVELDAVMDPWGRTPARRFGHRSVDTVRAVFGDATAPHVFGVAARLSGRRVLLPAARHGVTAIVAASSSPPPFAVPHVVDGRRYIDAGLISICSVDLAPAADLLVVAAPIAGPHMGTVGRFSERQTLRHVRHWKRKSGGRVLYVRPDRLLASAAGSGVQNLFESGRAEPARAAAHALVQQRLHAFADQDPQFVEDLVERFRQRGPNE